MRRRLAAYGYTYLACSFLASGLVLADLSVEASRKEVAERLAMCMMIGLFCVPVRMLLGIFPEPSSSSLVRAVRHPLFGLLCGPLPFFMIFGFLRAKGDQPDTGVLLGLGLLFGLVTGLVDSVMRDLPARGGDEGD